MFLRDYISIFLKTKDSFNDKGAERKKNIFPTCLKTFQNYLNLHIIKMS
jgi:hypothetical protein